MKKALADILVLDLTRVLAGPYCTMMLADYGAEVIKIEVPGKGDDTRVFGPLKNGASMYYANVNRGKKGVTLNLKEDKGKKIFLDMVKRADVVVENYRPGVMDKLGLGYEELKKIMTALFMRLFPDLAVTVPNLCVRDMTLLHKQPADL